MKTTFIKGQAITGIVVLTAMLTTAGNWILNRALTSPDSLSASIVLAEKDIVALKTSDQSQDRSILEMKANIEYIRRSIEEQNRRQGIIISPTLNAQ